jgi:hypothetical protein
MPFKDVARSPRRQASTTLVVLLAFGVLLAAAALAIDLAHLWEVRTSQENATDAAALAAAGALVDDRLLTGDPAAMVLCLRLARDEAVRYAAANPVLGEPLPLDPNDTNLPEGDVLFGTLDNPHAPLFVPAGNVADLSNPSLGLVNAVRITGRRTRDRGNAAGLYLGRAFAVPAADVVTLSTAMLDRDVVGLRPALNQPLPLVPIALLSDPGGTNPASWEAQVPGGRGPDDYRFDPATRTVVADATGDGIHEMEVTLADNACELLLGVADSAAVNDQVSGGVMPAQLQSLGGQLVLGEQNQLPLPAPPGCGPAAGTPEADGLAASLEQLRVRGDLRVWPLFAGLDGSSGAAVVTGFVAARVVRVEADGPRVRFTLQAGMLATPDLVTDASRRVGAGNPYLGKIRLVH